jgi:hypothetical protein
MLKAAKSGDKAALSAAADAVRSGIKAGKVAAFVAEALAIDLAKLGARVMFGDTSDGCEVMEEHGRMSRDLLRIADRYHPGGKKYFAVYDLAFHSHDRRFKFDNCVWEESVNVYSRKDPHPLSPHLVDAAYFEVTLPFSCSGSFKTAPGGGGSGGGGGNQTEGGSDGGSGPGGGGGSPVPETKITAGPPAVTTNDFATVYFESSVGGSSFECRFDSNAWVPCSNPKAYSQVAVGAHAASVRAVAGGVADPTPATHSWSRVAPDTEITAQPAAEIARHHVTIYFKSNETTDTTFQCSLDGSPWAACANPQSYSSVGVGSHTFRVRAVVLGAEDPTPAAASWTVVPPDTEITAGPHNSSSTTATVYFRSPNDDDAVFQCKFDSNAWVDCTNPKSYSSIAKGQHTVQVRAVDQGAEDPTPANITWTRT